MSYIGESLEVSIVIPCFNDSLSLDTLLGEIFDVLSKLHFNFEIIVVDDGSRQPVNVDTCKVKNVVVLRHRQNMGKSGAWQTGFSYARGQYIITLDADLQDNPSYIADFIASLRQGYEVVTGVRHGWQNGILRYLESRIYNQLVNQLFGTSIRDHNCGFKGFRADLVRGIQLERGQHRLLVATLASKGAVVCEVPIIHRPRRLGFSSYGLMRGFEFIYTVYKYWRKNALGSI